MNGWIILLCLNIYTFCTKSDTRNINGVIIDEEMQRVLLEKHNELRNSLALNGISESGQPQATYMNELHWDQMLAANSQQFTDKCFIGHNNNRVYDFKNLDSPKLSSFNYDSDDLSLGENFLWYPRTSNTIYTDATNMAEEHWWDEHLDYIFDTQRCNGVCGHYTQMSWADTRYVGCGASICPSNGYNYLFLVCEYYPSGNFNGNKPYNSGQPCSECSTLASDRKVCDGISNGQCYGCQSTDWNLCDDQWTNCQELGCPTSGISCKDDNTQWPCEYCLRSCDGCSDEKLSPSTDCDDNFNGLSYITRPTIYPTINTVSPSNIPTSHPIPTIAPIPTKQPTLSPTITGPKVIEVNGVEIDLDLQKIMLDKHNELRNNLALYGISESNQPKASYMNELHFDKALAATAQQYTNKCYSGHNNNRKNDFKNYYGQYSAFYYDSDRLSLGENFLYYPTYGESVYILAPKFAEIHWWNEHEDYDYIPNLSRGVTGHYTQMAWADTRYVGCGATLCQDYGYEYLFLICNYYPSGNYNYNRPYPQGEPCSDCLTMAPDRDQCDGITQGQCNGCQSLWWNWCDNYFTNCDDLDCPSSTICQQDSSNYPCDYCRRDCGTCTTDKLTPSPTCSDSNILYIDFPSSMTTAATTTKAAETTKAATTTKAKPTAAATTKAVTTKAKTTSNDGIEWQNWYCTEYRQCNEYPIKCPSGKHCNVYCRGYETCLKATIECAANTICNVFCSETSACLGLIIYGENALDVNVESDGGYQIQLIDSSSYAYSNNDSSNNDDYYQNNYNGLIVVICLLLILCLCLLIIGFFIHTRKIKDLESKLSNSTLLNSKDVNNKEEEIEVSLEMKNTNTNQAIVKAEDSE